MSNYEKVTEAWREKFLQMEHEQLIRRFHLEADEEALYVTWFSHRLRIDRKTGLITFTDAGWETAPAFHTVMTIYNMFYYAVENPQPSGKLVPFREVKRVYPFEAAYRKTILKELENTFSGHVEELCRACERLGGVRLPQGDAGYMLPVIPGLNIAVLFWDGDEEFPAQGNMLFDSNITDFMHEENVVSVAEAAVYYLTCAAGFKAKAIYVDEMKSSPRSNF